MHRDILIAAFPAVITVHVAFSLRLYTHHGRHDPAEVDRVATVQVIHPSVVLVLRADLE